MDTPEIPSLRPGITLAATPLGTLSDASFRLCQALNEADVIAAEDTRRTRALASGLGVNLSGKVVSHFEHNEADRIEELLAAARTQRVLVVSDAGMPLVSDPGHGLVQRAHDEAIPVTALPGPSAVTTAIAVSGLQVGAFAFDGFAPRKAGARRQWLESLRGEHRAVCFFDSPHRVATTLSEAAEILGGKRRATVCRELTKAYEEIRRGNLEDLARWAASGLRGEITVVVEGASTAAPEMSFDELVALVKQREARGERLKSACKAVAAEHPGVRANALYDAAVQRTE